MNKYDMSEFLECCISSCSKSGDKSDTCDMKELKNGINKFAIKHKKDIMDLFTFSETKGKYVCVRVSNLVKMMDEFDTYHSDMIQFIQSLQKINNERVDNLDKFQTLLDQAKVADEKFMNTLFDTPDVKVVFPDAVSNTEVLMRLSVLADEVTDNFIRLSQVSENTESARVSATIEFYMNSTKRFMSSISTKFFSTMEMLFEVKDGKPVKNLNSDCAYKLI